MAKFRGLLGDAEFLQRLVQRQLTRSGGKKVLAAQNMRDAHQCVIDRVNQSVKRRAVGTCNDVVRLGLRLEGQLTTNEVLPGPILLRHAQAPHWLAAFGLECSDLLISEIAVVIVVAQLRVTAGRLVTLFHFLGSGISRVDVATFLQLLQDIGIDVHALGLAVRLVRTARHNPLVPVHAQPLQGVNDGLIRLFRVTCSVGVFDAENQLATSMARVCPVKKRSTNHAHVRGAGGRWAETYAYVRSSFSHAHHGNAGPLGLCHHPTPAASTASPKIG